MAALEDKLARLVRLSPAEVEADWIAILGEAAPDLPPSLLRRALAYRLQAQAYGELPAFARRMVEKLAVSPSTQIPDAPIRLKPGTRLLREWNGRKHAVLATEQGLLFEGQFYRSLSQVARKITEPIGRAHASSGWAGRQHRLPPEKGHS